MSGNNTINQIGIYGTKGISSPTNIPGSRAVPISWIDSTSSSGNTLLWLFGGIGFDSTGTASNYFPKFNLSFFQS